MKLRQLRILAAVARQRNVTLAASELGISQPAVSLQLKKLEEEYEIRFYDRNKRGVNLTREGAAFLEAVRPILDQVERVEAAFKPKRLVEPQMAFTVGSNYLYSVTVIPDAVSDFIARHPDVQFVLETDHSFAIERRLQMGEIEIALISKPSFIPECIYEAYEEDVAVAFASSESRPAKGDLSLADLKNMPLVVTRDSACLRELRGRGFNPRVALQCDTPDAVKLAVKRGVGIGLLYRARIPSELEQGEFHLLKVPDLDSIRRTAFMVYDPRRPFSAVRADFLVTMRRVRELRRPGPQASRATGLKSANRDDATKGIRGRTG